MLTYTQCDYKTTQFSLKHSKACKKNQTKKKGKGLRRISAKTDARCSECLYNITHEPHSKVTRIKELITD